MAGTGAAVAIEAPPLTPPPNGLLSAAPVIDHVGDDVRWMNGVTFSPETCAGPVVFDPCSTTIGDALAVVTDGATNSNTTVTSATAAFSFVDVGKKISGAGIPANTTIAGVTNATTITISQAATATATGVTLTITGRNPGSNRPPSATFQPFGVEAYDTCSAFGYKGADFEGRARRALAAVETIGVEREFATAAIISDNRHLQDNTNTTKLVSSAAQDPRTGLALLVQSIADNKLGKGMIHARPFLVTMWGSFGLLRADNAGKLFTLTGTPVVPGYGYPGASPAGVAPTSTSEWAYATSFPQIHRGEVEVFAGEQDRAASLDRLNNTVTVRAMRMYSVAFNTCAVTAVNIDPRPA